jgi:hypothetical protein
MIDIKKTVCGNYIVIVQEKGYNELIRFLNEEDALKCVQGIKKELEQHENKK